MKRLLFVVTLASTFLLTSCLSDEEQIQYYSSLGTLQGESINNFVVVSDDGDTLRPIHSLPNSFKFENDKRVIVEFRLTDAGLAEKKYNVEIIYIQYLYQNDLLFVDDAARDTLKNSRVILPNNSVQIRGDYLNLWIQYRGTMSEKYVHDFYVVMDSAKQDKEGHIALDLVHNDNNDGHDLYFTRLMSVSLKDLREEGQDSVLIWLRANDDIYVPKTLVYYYEQEE